MANVAEPKPNAFIQLYKYHIFSDCMPKSTETLRERVKVLDLGRVTIPKNIRNKLGIQEGSILEVYTIKDKIVMELLVR